MTYSPGTTTVTMLKPAPDTLKTDLGLTDVQNAAGQVLALPHSDALALVTGAYARFGSDALDAALKPTNPANVPTHAV